VSGAVSRFLLVRASPRSERTQYHPSSRRVGFQLSRFFTFAGKCGSGAPSTGGPKQWRTSFLGDVPSSSCVMAAPAPMGPGLWEKHILELPPVFLTIFPHFVAPVDFCQLILSFLSLGAYQRPVVSQMGRRCLGVLRVNLNQKWRLVGLNGSSIPSLHPIFASSALNGLSPLVPLTGRLSPILFLF